MNLFISNNPLYISLFVILIMCLLAILGCLIYRIVIFFKNKKNNEQENFLNEALEKNNLSKEEVQDLILKNFEKLITSDTIKKIEELSKKSYEEIKMFSIYTIVNAMEETTTEIIDKTKNDITIPDDLIGRFIGKDGINIKTIEKLTECQIIVNGNLITISSFNSFRKEKAIRLINKLINMKSFDINRIEKNFEVIQKEFEQELISIGKKTLLDLNINGINEKIYQFIGRLKYRYSYSQNILEHSIECAKLASEIAKELELDSNIAKQAAFFHDIGKSIDFEQDNNHVKSGLFIAKQCNLNKYIIDAIASHHEDENTKYIYSDITKIADKLSSIRPGSRIENSEALPFRINEIETQCKNIKYVSKAYVIRGSKEVIVIVDSNTPDEEFKAIGLKIKTILRENKNINYMDIKVTVKKEQNYSV